MQKQVPTWLAVVVILVVLAIVVVFYLWRAQPSPQEPQAPFLKGQPAGPGQGPMMKTK